MSPSQHPLVTAAVTRSWVKPLYATFAGSSVSGLLSGFSSLSQVCLRSVFSLSPCLLSDMCSTSHLQITDETAEVVEAALDVLAGEVITQPGNIVLNEGRPTALLNVTNLCDRPVQVSRLSSLPTVPPARSSLYTWTRHIYCCVSGVDMAYMQCRHHTLCRHGIYIIR